MKSNPCTFLFRPKGFQGAVAPKLQESQHMKVVRLSVLRASCLCPRGNIPGTHFC